ncbi:site-specific integrase [Eubacteriales bacterium OttesenSCG-928-A19]|nr:site-specific integrase [Eubacteriales bacterium OttesenSCG-928-A19]
MGKRNQSGKLRGRVQIGVAADGKPINKYVCASNPRELEDLKEEVRRHYIDGEPTRDDMLFCDYAKEWYMLKKEPFVSDATKVSYRSCFTKHILPAFGLRHLRAISAQELQAFVNGYSGNSKSLITMIIGILKAVFAGAFAEGIIRFNPSAALVRPKAKKKIKRRALTAAETKRMLETIDRHKDGMFLAILYYLGVRRGEALGLKWGDFDFDEGIVHIQRDIDFVGARAHDGELKTEASERFVPIPEELYPMLKAHRELPDRYLFHTGDGKPLPQATYNRMWLQLMLAAGCTEERKPKPGTKRPDDIRQRFKATITPHYFRHNYVTMLYEAGIDPLIAMRLVGHSDYQTTADIYTHIKDELLKKSATKIDGVFSKRSAMKPIQNAINAGRGWGLGGDKGDR